MQVAAAVESTSLPAPQRVDAERQRADERGQVPEVRDLHADERRRESETERIAARLQLVVGVTAHGGDHREMQRPSVVASEPFAKRGCRVEPDVDVHIAERTAFDLEHAMRGEIAKATVETPERVAERCRREVDGDVALGLHAEQRREPSGADGMAGKSAQRVSTRDHVSPMTAYSRMLVPADACWRRIRQSTVGERARRHRGARALTPSAPQGDRVACAQAASSAAGVCARRAITKTWRVCRFAVADLLGPVAVHRGVESARAGRRRTGASGAASRRTRTSSCIGRSSVWHIRANDAEAAALRAGSSASMSRSLVASTAETQPAVLAAVARGSTIRYVERRRGRRQAPGLREVSRATGSAARSRPGARDGAARSPRAPSPSRPTRRCAFSAVTTDSSSGMSPIT